MATSSSEQVPYQRKTLDEAESIEDEENAPLYEDSYCKLTNKTIRLKTYYFPTGTDKVINLEKIQGVYYEKQSWSNIKQHFWKYKGWGTGCSPCWWACDLKRNIHGDDKGYYNVVLDINNWPYKGFTVSHFESFIEEIQTHIPKTAIVKGCLPF